MSSCTAGKGSGMIRNTIIRRALRLVVLALGLAVAGAGGFAGLRVGAAPVELTTQHLDLRVRHLPGEATELDLVITDRDVQPAVDYGATNVVLVVAEAGRLELPADLPPLGVSGDPIWVLPSSQREDLLFLGVSAGGIPAGVFDGPLGVRLAAVDGPGHFFVWQAELGELRFLINTRDGVGSDDVLLQAVGGHGHMDWGFSTSGVYRLTFEAEGRRVGEATNRVSEPHTFTFHVLPLPPDPGRPFKRWQERHWPGVSDAGVVGVGADPDGDGRVNLWEYVAGTSPVEADGGEAGRVRWDRVGGGAAMALEVTRVREATDVRFRVVGASDLLGEWVPEDFVMETEEEDETRERLRFRVPVGVGTAGLKFLRLEVSLEPVE